MSFLIIDTVLWVFIYTGNDTQSGSMQSPGQRHLHVKQSGIHGALFMYACELATLWPYILRNSFNFCAASSFQGCRHRRAWSTIDPYNLNINKQLTKRTINEKIIYYFETLSHEIYVTHVSIALVPLFFFYNVLSHT